ncbi:MAG: ferritin-like domain-containing protein [Alphaproteobacteria bacterium]
MPNPETLAQAACRILNTADGAAKARTGRLVADAWKERRIFEVGACIPPARPARPDQPVLLPPNKMPKRRASGALDSRIALLHALAHIELNAIDLAWDLVARFTSKGLPRAFFDDWVSVAADEGEHFLLVRDRLRALSADYGQLPAHDGLWQAAEATAGDLSARLAIVPLVLEARGLDVTPGMIAKLEAAGDHDSAGILETIYRDEIGHVAIGKRWFDFVCDVKEVDSRKTWQSLVQQYFRGNLKPPFNHDARNKAGLTQDYYLGTI